VATILTALDKSELVTSFGTGARTIGWWQGPDGITLCCSVGADHPVRTNRRFSAWQGTLHFLMGATKLFASGLTGGVYSVR
jgi:hypothetical protein